MKREYIKILLVILVFAGVALLGNTPVRAEFMIPCTEQEIGDAVCFQTYQTNTDSVEIPVWVVRAWIRSLERAATAADLGTTKWPWSDAAGLHYGYKGGITQDVYDCVKNKKCSKPSAWSYTVAISNANIIDSEPTGAAMEPSNLPACDVDINTIQNFFKLNPNVTFNKTGYWEYITAGGSFDLVCGELAILWSDVCVIESIVMPTDLALIAQNFSFGTIDIRRDPCTGVILGVSQDGVEFDSSCSPYICFGHPSLDDCIDLRGEGKRVGPPFFGCLFDDEPVAMYGYNNSFFCEPSSP